jgi:hypothetical protein
LRAPVIAAVVLLGLGGVAWSALVGPEQEDTGAAARWSEAPEEVTAAGAALQRVLAQEFLGDSALSVEHGVDGEPNPMWLKPDYYVNPSSYVDLRSYFQGLDGFMAVTIDELTSRRLLRHRLVSALEAEGVLHAETDSIYTEALLETLLSNYDALVPIALGWLQTAQEWARAAVELHDYLVALEGKGAFVHGVAGEPIFMGTEAEREQLTRLEQEVGLLSARHYANLQESADFLGGGPLAVPRP